eukprot:TRINITY_DN94751_c0_g1_i1.p3 TRINITY_DN94751_c0_g1~~TRINITY_DN94751_c0_g1_i1.p3  ORF type:complete len:110 (-),score=1.89 TRINITY_DN94751_c0_g1_i1:240-569(-)
MIVADRPNRGGPFLISVVPSIRGELSALAGPGSVLHHTHGVYLDAVTVSNQPADYETRLQRWPSSNEITNEAVMTSFAWQGQDTFGGRNWSVVIITNFAHILLTRDGTT